MGLCVCKLMLVGGWVAVGVTVYLWSVDVLYVPRLFLALRFVFYYARWRMHDGC
jgi:hypothetical protein